MQVGDFFYYGGNRTKELRNRTKASCICTKELRNRTKVYVSAQNECVTEQKPTYPHKPIPSPTKTKKSTSPMKEEAEFQYVTEEREQSSEKGLHLLLLRVQQGR